MPVLFSRRHLLGASLALAATHRADAAGLAPPAGKVILTIDGAIDVHNRPAAADFDRPMLEAMGISRIVTGNPWQTGDITFEGVRMDALLAAVGAKGSIAKVAALNDFTTEIPVEDFARYGVVLAWKANGAYLEPRDKGPLFVIYPFKENPALQKKTYYDRSAWQVRRITIG